VVLQLFEDDLLPERRDVPTSLVKFEHFITDVQAAIATVGRATFARDRHTANENYSVVYPPKSEPEPYICPNCGKHTRHELRCIDCGMYFCNYCMSTKTVEEIGRSENVKCPGCGSMNTKSIEH
jgi:hypothetical protein